MKVVLLNALPLNAFPMQNFTLKVQSITINELKTLISDKQVVNYVRHQATVSLLSSLLNINLQANPSTYQFTQGDTIVVITLKTPQRGQEVTTISVNDLIIYKVEVVK